MSIYQQLTDKSWATHGVVGAVNDRSRGLGPAAKTGLSFLLAVLSSMFMLFIVGYRLRMAESDWVALTDPKLLWLNTLMLVLSSVFMQLAKRACEADRIGKVRNNLTLGGLLGIGFLIGQFFAWRQIQATGHYAASDPAAAFFFLLTGLHALHLLGGMYVWSKSVYGAWRRVEVAQIRLSVELCTTYWHYLLLVWLAIFTLLLST